MARATVYFQRVSDVNESQCSCHRMQGRFFCGSSESVIDSLWQLHPLFGSWSCTSALTALHWAGTSLPHYSNCGQQGVITRGEGLEGFDRAVNLKGWGRDVAGCLWRLRPLSGYGFDGVWRAIWGEAKGSRASHFTGRAPPQVILRGEPSLSL